MKNALKNIGIEFVVLLISSLILMVGFNVIAPSITIFTITNISFHDMILIVILAQTFYRIISYKAPTV